MDFEGAAERLAKDQSKIRKRGQVVVSAKAKREAEFRRKQQERMQAERKRKQLQLAFQKQYMTRCDRELKVRSLAGVSEEIPKNQLMLQPTSIHGDGDKIALPPSVLERLTADLESDNKHTPWMFRFAIPKSDYKFPASPLLCIAKPKGENEDDDDEEMSDDDDENHKAAYLDELAHKYAGYTHGTVVEFTQDEGYIGITQSIASALLGSSPTIPVTRTVDPAEDSMKEDAAAGDEGEEKTPGHLAYGAFDVPDTLIEITRVTLPKGRGCTLVPTEDAIRHGFYGLKDVKMVLEQSLSRTRATLSVGDSVSTWHRGVKFNLSVTKVLPSTFQAISCINTDIEVDFEAPGSQTVMPSDIAPSLHATAGSAISGTSAVSLPSIPDQMETEAPSAPAPALAPPVELLAEPPADQKENVLTIQMQSDTGRHRRRFDVTKATMADMFSFAKSVSSAASADIRLVTRFPRRVFTAEQPSQTLQKAGLVAGQEVFLIEKS